MPPDVPCRIFAPADPGCRSSAHEALQQIATSSPVTRLAIDAPLFSEGEPGQRIFFVRSGELCLYLSTESGHEVEMCERTAGMTAGLEVLFFGSYHTSARATRPTTVHVIRRSVLSGLLDDTPKVARALLIDSLTDVFLTRQRLLDYSARCATERLAAFLLKDAVAGPAGLELKLPRGSKARLARRIGIKQETLSRLFQLFTDRGAITVYPGGIGLKSPQTLRSYLR